MEYDEFISTKEKIFQNVGFDPVFMPDILFDFQKALTEWAIKKGRSAVWAGTGLGKTGMQLSWAKNVNIHTDKPVLILAPLAIPHQTKQEGIDKFDVDVNICTSGDDVINGVNITNYEKLHKFDTSVFSGVVLEESSILKNFSGKIRNQVIDSFANTPYKLCCSATPSPNDFTEIGNHAEFLNVCSRLEMLATYFVHDSGSTQKWRLKGHAEKEFFKWVSGWAVMIEKPSDIGFSDDKMKLPKLNIFEHRVESPPDPGEIFITLANTLNERRQARRESLQARCQLAADLNNNSDEIFFNWCDLNDESATLKKMIEGSTEVKGADKNHIKEKNLIDFKDGKIKNLISKPKIASQGLNFQICHNTCFVGLSDSFEAFYQAVRRFYRFGQTHEVNVHIIISDKEGNVIDNIKRKEANAKIMLAKMVQHVSLNTIKHLRSEKITNTEMAETFKLPKFL